MAKNDPLQNPRLGKCGWISLRSNKVYCFIKFESGAEGEATHLLKLFSSSRYQLNSIINHSFSDAAIWMHFFTMSSHLKVLCVLVFSHYRFSLLCRCKTTHSGVQSFIYEIVLVHHAASWPVGSDRWSDGGRCPSADMVFIVSWLIFWGLKGKTPKFERAQLSMMW